MQCNVMQCMYIFIFLTRPLETETLVLYWIQPVGILEMIRSKKIQPDTVVSSSFAAEVPFQVVAAIFVGQQCSAFLPSPQLVARTEMEQAG